MSRLILTLLISLMLSTSAFAQDNGGLANYSPDNVQQVTFLLSGYHEIGSAADFAAVPNAPAIVDTIARGPNGMVRDRALIALGRYWPSADVYLLYAQVVASNDTPEGTRHRVVQMFARAFGDRSIPALKPLLQSNDLQLQITTVEALGAIGSDASHEVLVAFAKTTTNPLLNEHVDRLARVVR